MSPYRRSPRSLGLALEQVRDELAPATLLAACCDIGALLGGLDDAKRVVLRSYGRLLGLAFQIADDVLDYEGSEDEIGKPIGHDIADGFAEAVLMLKKRADEEEGRPKPTPNPKATPAKRASKANTANGE